MTLQQTALTDLALSASMHVGADKLTISYTVANRSKRDLYLFNRLFNPYVGGPGIRIDADLASIEFRDEDVVVAKKLVPVPDDMDVESPDEPCVMLLAPGAQTSETVQLKLPLQPHTPYMQGTGARPGMRAARFELGYFFGEPGTRAMATSVQTNVGPLLYFDSFSAHHQSLISVGPFDPVPTLED